MSERKKRPPIRKPTEIPRPLPPRTEEEQEKRACGLAMDLAMKWMEEGTAPAQVVVHFLKIASIREQAELDKTKKEISLLEAKIKSFEVNEMQTEKYDEILRCMSEYAGKESEWEVIGETSAPVDYEDVTMD